MAEKELATVPATPEAMLAHAMELKLEPTAMTEFYALYREMKADRAREQFATAMASFRSECGLVAKSKAAKILMKSGATFSFDYSPIEEVAATINPIAAKYRFSYRFDDASTDKLAIVTCYVLHEGGHEVSSTGRCPVDNDSKMSPANAATAAWTTARRKAMMQVWGLIATDEVDAEAVGGGSGQPITPEQAANLRAAVEGVGGDPAKFLKMLGCDSFESVPMSKYGEALAAIEKKRKGAK